MDFDGCGGVVWGFVRVVLDIVLREGLDIFGGGCQCIVTNLGNCSEQDDGAELRVVARIVRLLIILFLFGVAW